MDLLKTPLPQFENLKEILKPPLQTFEENQPIWTLRGVINTNTPVPWRGLKKYDRLFDLAPSSVICSENPLVCSITHVIMTF